MSNIKERIHQLVETKGLSMSSFERNAGLSNGYVSKIRKSISVDVYEKILRAYPDVNREWLMTGSGEMLSEEKDPPQDEEHVVQATQNRAGVPVYDIDATCGKTPRDIEFAEDIIIGYIDLPNVRSDCKIIRANGDSMSPKISDGNWLAIREIFDFDDIFYGQIYVVVTSEYRMTKYIRKYEPDEKNYLILHSENENYDDITIRKDKIHKLFIVENILAVTIQI